VAAKSGKLKKEGGDPKASSQVKPTAPDKTQKDRRGWYRVGERDRSPTVGLRKIQSEVDIPMRRKVTSYCSVETMPSIGRGPRAKINF